MDDRRSKPRLSISLDAVWERSGDTPSARLTNLSEGGCFMDTVGEVRQGEIVAFRVLMPDEDWLYLEGEVRHHVKGIGFGVQFLDLNDEQEAKVKELIRIAKESGPGAKLTADLVED
ncbi:MAG: PilZ domain-containing protein [Pyrinomonadaceae bacterium]